MKTGPGGGGLGEGSLCVCGTARSVVGWATDLLQGHPICLGAAQTEDACAAGHPHRPLKKQRARETYHAEVAG